MLNIMNNNMSINTMNCDSLWPKKQGIVKRHIKGELYMFQGVILWKHGNMHSQTPHTIRVEKKTQPTCFFVFLKEIRFFLKKTEKPHPELFSFHHAISLVHS